jgi:Inner centromere protein, ARK binding region
MKPTNQRRPHTWQSPSDAESDSDTSPRTAKHIQRKRKMRWARTPELELALASQSVQSIESLFQSSGAVDVSLTAMFSPTRRCLLSTIAKRTFPYQRRRSSLDWVYTVPTSQGDDGIPANATHSH